MKCRLCASDSQRVFNRTLLNRYDVGYFHCPECDLLLTEKPYWLEEAYSDELAALDVGAVQRTLKTAGLTRLLLLLLEGKKFSRCLDYGGGPGVFTRLMRDYGFPFFLNDKYCPNLYAKGFQGATSDPNDFITCFEVFEHFDRVGEELDNLFVKKPSYILAGTELRWNIPKEWWYYSDETGQHIAFYSPKTMQWLGRKYGYQALVTNEFTLFIKNDNPISPILRLVLPRILNRAHLAARWGARLSRLFPMPSLGPLDVEYLIGHKRMKTSPTASTIATS